MTTHRWGIAAILVAVVLSGCHKALTPAAKQGYASAATPRERVATDRVAENLAYRAYYNSDAAALATLEVRAKTDPAFRWGLYKFYTLEASHFGPDMGTPLLTKAIRGISTPRAAEHEHKREALIARAETDQQKDQTRLQKKSLLLLEQAVAKNDPAAENALAGEYWSEPNRAMAVEEAGGVSQVKMNDENQAWFKAARTMCTDGFRLAQKSLAAGWPGAYMTLVLFHLTPKGPIERTSSAMTTTEFMLATQCAGQAYPSSIPSALRNSASLTRYAAQHGSIRAIAEEVIRACSGGQKRATARWLRQLKKLATAGSVRAQIDLKAMIAYAHSRCGVK